MSNLINTIFIAALFIGGSMSAFAQARTDVAPGSIVADYMTYQGRLMNAGAPANGSYDFEFTITNSAGTTVETAQVLGVPVTNGIFTARFLINLATFASNGGAYIGVGVRQLPTDPYTPLAPRQPISATPTAFKAHEASFALLASNATQLGGVSATQYVQTDDPRLNDTREPAAGSANYIQNTTTPQAADFNISGTGTASLLTAGTINAQFQYSLNGLKLISAPGSGNLFAGYSAGSSNTTGADNTYFGKNTGVMNATASGASFFGSGAGRNSIAVKNSFFGKEAGTATTTGFGNSFFGFEAGYSNVIGFRNTFFGSEAGRASTGSDNTFVGFASGGSTTTGVSNAFYGVGSGGSNTTGSFNVFLGNNTGDSNSTGLNNVFIGTDAGDDSTTGSDNVFIGAYAGHKNISGSRNIFIGSGSGGFFNELANDNILIGHNTDTATDVSNSVAIGSGVRANLSNQIVLGATTQNTLVSGKLGLGNVPIGGSAPLCLEPINKIVSICSANIDLKTSGGSNAVNQQQAKIDSLQTLVSDQQKQIQKQQEQIELLKRVVCETNATAAVCKEKE